MPGVVYLNGEFLPRERATLSVDDRGFIFGDGIYEVTRVVNGRLFEADRHMRRLQYGLRGIGIDPRMTPEQIIDIHNRLIRENDLTTGEGTVYLQITRGAAPRTHYFPPASTPPDGLPVGVAVHAEPRAARAGCDGRDVSRHPLVALRPQDGQPARRRARQAARGRRRVARGRVHPRRRHHRGVAHERVRRHRRRAAHVSAIELHPRRA